MKISTKGKYGLTIMIELAKRFGEGPTSLRMIAEENNLSEHYLEQIVAPLRNSQLVRSVRGAYGGYILNEEPKDITAGDVIRVLEGPIVLVEGLSDEDPAQRALWLRMSDAMKNVLDSTTLADLVANTASDANDSYMFYI